MSVEVLKKEFVPKYLSDGEPKFYRFLILLALNELILSEKGVIKTASPEIRFLEYYNQFIILYRREGEQVYLDMARIFRKAAHKIYRALLKKNIVEKNTKFLNLV